MCTHQRERESCSARFREFSSAYTAVIHRDGHDDDVSRGLARSLSIIWSRLGPWEISWKSRSREKDDEGRRSENCFPGLILGCARSLLTLSRGIRDSSLAVQKRLRLSENRMEEGGLEMLILHTAVYSISPERTSRSSFGAKFHRVTIVILFSLSPIYFSLMLYKYYVVASKRMYFRSRSYFLY